jgi:hypothetical protein
MRISFITLMILTFFALSQMSLQAQTATPTMGADAENAAIQQEKEKIELEKLQLEDAQLKLKLIQAQQQLSPMPTPTPQPVVNNSDQAKKALEDLKIAESKKAEALAKEAKEKTDVFILDLVNNEIWYKGVRYGMFEFQNLAADQNWKVAKTVDERDPSGHARYLYAYQNAALLKYENKDQGIFSMKMAAETGDMDFLTPEGLSFRSSTGDVRDNSPSAYFKYDSQRPEKDQKVLKYVSAENFLGFDVQVEFWFNRHDKMTQIRCGLLGQH